MREIHVKPGVKLAPQHFTQPEVGAIVRAADISYPKEIIVDGERVPYILTITRGCEQVKGGKKRSRHLPPRFAAFDFRTRDLPPEIDRDILVHRIQRGLGPRYYVYFGDIEVPQADGSLIKIEWIHIQWNG